ncbi:MAG: YceI family protein [Phyllobacterium sp.]
MLGRVLVFLAAMIGGFDVASAASVSLSDAAGRYAITPDGSSLAFAIAAVSGPGIRGRFVRFNGNINIDPKDVERSTVRIVIFPDSVATGEARMERFLRSDAVFDVARQNAITFRSTRVTRTGADTATIEGQLTARGKTFRQTFNARLDGLRGSRIRFHVQGRIMRSPYGMDVGTPIYSNVVDFNMSLNGNRL